MSISRAFKAFFKDSHWLKKVALGAVIMLIPYVGAIAYMGFGLRYLRDVAWGRDAHLPEWKDFVEHLKTGLYGMVVGLVASIPLTIAMAVLVVIAAAGTGVFMSAQSPSSIIWLFLALLFVFSMLTLLMGIVLWPAYVQVALYNTVQAGFDFKGIYARTRAHAQAFWSAFGKYVLLSLASLGITLAVYGVVFGIIGLTFVGTDPDQAPVAMMLLYPLQLIVMVPLAFLTIPIGLMNNHIWGQYARVAYSLEATAVPSDATPGTTAGE